MKNKKKIFISHSTANGELAWEICQYLEAQGKLCFYAPRDIRNGFEYAEEIIRGIDESHILLLLLSKEANESPHVLREIERAVSKRLSIIIYKLEEVDLSKSLEYFIMAPQWIDGLQVENGNAVILNTVNELETAIGENALTIHKLKNGDIGQNGKTDIKILKLAVGVIALCVVVIAIVMFSGVGAKNNQPEVTKLMQDDANTSDTTQQPQQIECTKEPENSENVTPTGNENIDLSKVKLGDTVKFGSYYEQPIIWQVYKKNDDGSAVLVSKDIITIKAFDGAESGRSGVYNGEIYTDKNPGFDIQIQIRGNNSWSKSNLRTWLNSSEKSVKYSDAKPNSSAMSELHNAYDEEAGFLYGFSEEEKSRIVKVTNRYSEYTESGVNEIESVDMVYILSEADMEQLQEAGIDKYAKKTEAAQLHDEAHWEKSIYEFIDNDLFMYWLMDANENTGCYVKVMGNGSDGFDIFLRMAANLEGVGVRPVITIK